MERLADRILRFPVPTVGDLAVKFDVLAWLLLNDGAVVYLYGCSHPDETPEMDVVFVLTLGTGFDADNVFNQMHSSLGAFVENSTIDTNIDVDV